MVCVIRGISLPEEYWEQLQERRAKEGTSIAAQIRVALERAGFVHEGKNG